jgi:uncharacterized glyoxalase superfamily protein PhnB
MTTFTSVTPNLLVRDIDRSTAFYRDVLGFSVKQTVPDTTPFVFVWLEREGVPVFLNDPKAADFDVSARPFGGSATLYFVVTDVDALHARVSTHANILMPLKQQFYGMREFAVEDPDGHILTFAERVG